MCVKEGVGVGGKWGECEWDRRVHILMDGSLRRFLYDGLGYSAGNYRAALLRLIKLINGRALRI